MTKRHKLFSVDRGDWIRAGNLEPSEYLKTKHGPNKIVSIESLPGVHQVYNIEVETDHCYFVTSGGVLCHNVSGCGQDAPKKGPKPNGGNAKPHGNPDHDAKIDGRLDKARNEGASNIRKNQQQVDVDGNKVGNNRPDGQWDQDGTHHNYEADRSQSSSTRHRNQIEQNDPASNTETDILN